MNGITNKLEELKQHAYTTQPDIITRNKKPNSLCTSKTPKITNYTLICTDRVVKLDYSHTLDTT